MWVGVREIGGLIGPRWPEVAGVGGVAGVLWLLGARVGLGRLPGDVVIRGERFTFYFPLATCIVLSVVLSLLAWFVQRVGR